MKLRDHSCLRPISRIGAGLFLLLTACDNAKPRPADPRSPEAIVAMVEAAHGPAALESLAYDAFSRISENDADRTRAAEAALLQKLDLRKFEHGYFLAVLAGIPSTESDSPKVEEALMALEWPAIPAAWSAAECRAAFDTSLRNGSTEPFPPGLGSARRRLAARLWPAVSKDPGMQERLARANRTPLKALVAALTAGFDLRVRVVADGTPELPEYGAGNDVTGHPITAMGTSGIPARVERTLARLASEAFGKLELGFAPEGGHDFTGTPAVLEAHYEVKVLRKLYEMFAGHAYAIRLTARVTLRVGDQEWSSAEASYEADEKVEFDMNSKTLAEAILDNALDKLFQDLLAALLKEQ
ncbi:MAG: hypothetical protein K8T20_11900 [Planctomycetes bacterium]|nr:hypothetical protein [Planctomycetota bacterium]